MRKKFKRFVWENGSLIINFKDSDNAKITYELLVIGIFIIGMCGLFTLMYFLES